MSAADTTPRHGVLAFGDSITHAGGELQWGVALHSWALWTARGLAVPYTGYAVDGALAGDVRRRQIPAFRDRSAVADARFDVGCLYIGVNDVRGPTWDPAAFAADYEPALRFLVQRCDRTLTATAPLALGLPPAGPKVPELNAVVRDVAARVGALVVDLEDLHARNWIMPDRVHPTAFGQIAIAERALAVLAADGLPTRVPPASLIRYETTRAGRLRGDWTYAYRDAKERTRGLRLRFTVAVKRALRHG